MSTNIKLPDSMDISWHDGGYYVSVPNYKGGTVYTSEHVQSLCEEYAARITATEERLEEALGIVRSVFDGGADDQCLKIAIKAFVAGEKRRAAFKATA